MWNDAKWIGVPKTELQKWQITEGDLNGHFAYFCYEFELTESGSCEISITANSRYRLWVNEIPIMSGPCKGDRYRHYYDTVRLDSFLMIGRNVIAVQVLYCNPYSVHSQSDEKAPLFSVVSAPCGHRLAVGGCVRNGEGKLLENLTTGIACWSVYLEGSFYLTGGDEATANLGAVKENIDCRYALMEWRKRKYDRTGWAKAVVQNKVVPSRDELEYGLYPFYRLTERPVPYLYEREEPFCGQTSVEFVDGSFTVPAGGRKIIVLDAAVHTNAYMRYRFFGGRGARISITYAEKYIGTNGEDIKRTDRHHGILKGITDTLILCGKDVVYEPFWVRTFRFIQIEIATEGEEVQVPIPVMRKTGYPLEINYKPEFLEPWKEQLWEIGIRTLQNCMLETYMDCPFYEQMQFVMDTRLQALFTYEVSGDTRLAQKALWDFHCSMIPEGLVQGKYPSAYTQIISTFSFYYIFMLEEYYRYTKDGKILRCYRNDVDRILEYYHGRIGRDGLVRDVEYWPFVDWQEQWLDTKGVPKAASFGPSTIINLMYASALKSGAYIFDQSGRNGIAEEYEERRKQILNSIQTLCWDEEKKLYREGPDVRQFSQHAQSWAILNGMVDRETACVMLRRTLEDSEVLQCTFSTRYELFRAYEWAGIYEETKPLMQEWRKLLDLECTTCPEVPTGPRSECHGWSALPVYEFIRHSQGKKNFILSSEQ